MIAHTVLIKPITFDYYRLNIWVENFAFHNFPQPGLHLHLTSAVYSMGSKRLLASAACGTVSFTLTLNSPDRDALPLPCCPYR